MESSKLNHVLEEQHQVEFTRHAWRHRLNPEWRSCSCKADLTSSFATTAMKCCEHVPPRTGSKLHSDDPQADGNSTKEGIVEERRAA